MHSGQSETISVDHLDVNALRETLRKTLAIEADAGQLYPVCFNLYGSPRKLYFAGAGASSAIANYPAMPMENGTASGCGIGSYGGGLYNQGTLTELSEFFFAGIFG